MEGAGQTESLRCQTGLGKTGGVYVCVGGGVWNQSTDYESNVLIHIKGMGCGPAGGVIAGILCSYFKEWRVFRGGTRHVQTHLPARDFPPSCSLLLY